MDEWLNNHMKNDLEVIWWTHADYIMFTRQEEAEVKQRWAFHRRTVSIHRCLQPGQVSHRSWSSESRKRQTRNRILETWSLTYDWCKNTKVWIFLRKQPKDALISHANNENISSAAPCCFQAAEQTVHDTVRVQRWCKARRRRRTPNVPASAPAF